MILTPKHDALRRLSRDAHDCIPRSDKWPEVERAHLEKHPQCAACTKMAILPG